MYVLLCVSAHVNRIFGMCISFFDCLLSSSPPALHLCFEPFTEFNLKKITRLPVFR